MLLFLYLILRYSIEYACGVNKPALPECIDKYIFGLYDFNKSLIAFVSGSENGSGPELVYYSKFSYF